MVKDPSMSGLLEMVEKTMMTVQLMATLLASIPLALERQLAMEHRPSLMRIALANMQSHMYLTSFWGL